MASGFASNRRRSRHWPLRLAGAVMLVALTFVAATAAYRLAASRYSAETELLRHDLASLHDDNLRLAERTAAAEQQGALAIGRAAEAERDRDAKLPQGDAARLLGLVQARLAAGVSADRLAFVIDRTRNEPACDPKLEAHRIEPRTPLSMSALVTASFFDDKVAATAQAATARGTTGKAPVAFDPSQPVDLRFTKIGGGIETAKGVLPLGHAFPMQGKELRFMARASDKQPGTIELTMQVCG